MISALDSLSAEKASAPLVTFGIPAYNRPNLLRETLASIFAQSDFDDFEVVVCDDGGLAETQAECSGFPPGKVTFHRNQPPLGAVENWNRCIQLARGRWVMVLHEDDTLYPWYAKAVIGRLREGLSAICMRTLQGERPQAMSEPLDFPIKEYLPAYFLKSAMTPFPGVLFPRSLALRLGGFDASWGPLADYDFWYRLACEGKVEVVQRVGAFYRVVPGQWTDREWPRMLRLAHLLRLKIVRERFQNGRLNRWFARFFTYRNALAYRRRFPQKPSSLGYALKFKRIPLSGVPSGWVWLALKLSARA